MNFSETVTICRIMKIKGQKPNLEAISAQQIALLATNDFFSSFAPVRPRVSFRCKKKQRETARSEVKCTFPECWPE